MLRHVGKAVKCRATRFDSLVGGGGAAAAQLIGLIREEAHRDAPLGDLLCKALTKPCKSKANKASKSRAKATLGATEEIKIEL